MKESERHELARILKGADEAFLVALANKGLLRRAQKGLESTALQMEETADCLIVRAADWTVWMPPGGPVHARDDTRASGVTWQVLAATIYLREQWTGTELSEDFQAGAGAESAQGQTAEPEKPNAVVGEALLKVLLELSIDDLSKWAGKRLLAECMALAKETVELEQEFNLGLTLRFPKHDIELRLLNTKERGARLLEQVLSTAPKALHKRWVLTALLCLNRKHGRELSISQEIPLESAESPRSRQQILVEIKKLLESMLANGVAHPSSRIIERLFTLSMSASAVHLPRLSHLLRMLADEVSSLLNRDAAADTQRLFSSMSWTYCLVKATEAAGKELTRQLAGEARTQYDPAGDLRLTGIAAYPWQTASGYQGLSVLFWESASQRVLSWSASRPNSQAAQFDLAQVYQATSVWAGGGSPQRLCRSRFDLKQVRLNALGRISQAQQTKVENIAIADSLPELDFGNRLFKDWASLQAYAAQQFPIGLSSANPLARIVILEPGSWGERYFDEMQQAFCWTIFDQNYQALKLTLPWNEVNERSIEFLEALKPERDRLQRVVARIVFFGLGFAMEPLSFITKGRTGQDYVLNPSFDRTMIESRQSDLLSRLRKKFNLDRIATAMTSDDEWEAGLESSSLQQAVPVAIRNALVETEGLLLQLAESGTQQLPESMQERFSRLAARLNHCGLIELGQSLESIALQKSVASNVMWTDYLCQLHWQAVTQSFRF